MMLTIIKSLYFRISNKNKIYLFLLFLIMVLSSIAELVSIGLMLPFISIVINKTSTKVIEGIILEWFGHSFKSSDEQFIYFISIVFIIAIILAAVIRILMLWSVSRVALKIGSELSSEIFKKTIRMKYLKYLSINSSDLINNTTYRSTSIIHHIIVPLFIMLSSFFIAFIIFSALFFINYQLALLLAISFFIIYFAIAKIVLRSLTTISSDINKLSSRIIKITQESIGSIRDIILDNNYQIHLNSFSKADKRLRLSQSSSLFIAQSPKYIIEALIMILLIFFLVINLTNNKNLTLLPAIGALLFGAQRLMPLLQNAYHSWTEIKSHHNDFTDVINFLNENTDTRISSSNKKIHIKSDIWIKNLSFSYQNGLIILKNINLKFKIGSIIGLSGKSGSGKSTLVDLIMGLIDNYRGEIGSSKNTLNKFNIDSWQSQISHVPQKVFLIDDTIKKNIAFGVDEKLINMKLLKLSAEIAGLKDFIESLPYKYETVVGEQGSSLSGGQIQRIGIARAVYKKPKILILDEATNALDLALEKLILFNLKRFFKSSIIIFISHRLSTFKYCNKIVKISNGYASVISKKEFCAK